MRDADGVYKPLVLSIESIQLIKVNPELSPNGLIYARFARRQQITLTLVCQTNGVDQETSILSMYSRKKTCLTNQVTSWQVAPSLVGTLPQQSGQISMALIRRPKNNTTPIGYGLMLCVSTS
jgi:hypothetical protein